MIKKIRNMTQVDPLAFTPQRLDRELTLDRLMRWSSMVIMFIVFIEATSWQGANNLLANILMFTAAGLWVFSGVTSARVAQALPQISELLDHDFQAGGTLIGQCLRRRPLNYVIRLMLYHRLAVLRHRQQQFAQSAVICEALLEQNLSQSPELRAPLLLILIESRLHFGDLPGAYLGLSQLHTLPMSLTELLQLLALQTRYEILCGHDRYALKHLHQKLELAELMPAAQCGAIHTQFATAAQNDGQHELAHWLRQRALLLTGSEQRPTWTALWPAEPDPTQNVTVEEENDEDDAMSQDDMD